MKVFTLGSALYSFCINGKYLVIIIKDVLWVIVHIGVFYIYKNFLEKFYILPGHGDKTIRDKGERENMVSLLISWKRKEVNSYGTIFFL